MFGFLRRCSQNLARYHQYRESARTLAALDDRQLKDIGISRSQISAAVGEVLCVGSIRNL